MSTHPFWSVDTVWGRVLTPPLSRLESNSQTMTALGTAGCDDLAAALGAHADQETVGALAAHDGGLIRAFHDDFLS